MELAILKRGFGVELTEEMLEGLESVEIKDYGNFLYIDTHPTPTIYCSYIVSGAKVDALPPNPVWHKAIFYQHYNFETCETEIVYKVWRDRG